MELTLARASDVPIYRQIVNQVRDHIQRGELGPGSRMPAVRQLATQCGLTRLTVHSAYAELQAQGLVESHVGRGTFVAAGVATTPRLGPKEQPAPWVSQGVLANLLRWREMGDLLSFAQAFPAPETYPTRDLGKALQLSLKEANVLGYGHIQGELELRQHAVNLLVERGLTVSPDRMLITAGAQQGIDLVLRASTKPDDVILVEEPVYPGILELAAQRGQPVVGVPNEGGDIRVDILEAQCAAHRPRLLYLVPSFNNPTGRALTQASREAVLRVASEHNLLIVEDDTYGYLGFDHPAPPAMASTDSEGRVVFITSFSKMLAPALRLGVLVAPVAMLSALAVAKQSSDLVCSALMQSALANYLRQGHLQPHLRQVRSLYSQRRDATLKALQRHLPQCTWSHPEGGLSLLVRLPQGIIEHDFTSDALERGVGFAPGAVFFPEPQNQGSFRLSFGMQSPERIEEGVKVLGEVLDSHLSRREKNSSLRSGAAGPLV